MKSVFQNPVGLVVNGLLATGLLALLAPWLLLSAKAQTAEAGLGVRSLTPAEFSALNLSPRPRAYIPTGLMQSRNPQPTRGTIGADDRVEMLSRLYPWSAIGRVVFQTAEGESGHCSGTLVAADVVLTNAHCVVDPETHTVYSTISFQPNVIDNVVRSLDDVATAQAVFYGTDFRDQVGPPHPDDWAFIKLDQPLGDRYGTLPWRGLPISDFQNDYAEDLVMAGYSGDFPEENPAATAGVHLGCSVLYYYEESLAHNCDTFGGSSGGPIFTWINDQPYIVGINSAEWSRETSTLAPDGSERTTRVGIVNYAVDVTRIVQFIESAPGQGIAP